LLELREGTREESADSAKSEMKYIVAALYTNYTTTVVDDSGIEQSDAYTAPPTSDRLLIELHHVKAG
jgi:hypothetical protein